MLEKNIEAERKAREKYSGGYYKPETITVAPSAEEPFTYADRMLRLKLDLIEEELSGPVFVDLCCGNGLHLRKTMRPGMNCIGIDFSEPFLSYALRAATEFGSNNKPYFCCANAKVLPLADKSVDGLYSISSLYTVLGLEEVIKEIARVLKPGGRAVLDLGNRWSLNTFVCRYYPDAASQTSPGIMKTISAIKNSGLEIRRHRSFQILPMWADKPKFLKPLLLPFWTRLLAHKIRGRMIDEWISSMPLLRRIAFRHIIVIEKIVR